MNVRTDSLLRLAERYLHRRRSRTLARMAGLVLLATSLPLAAEGAAGSAVASDAQPPKARTLRASPELAMQGTARCDDAIQLPAGWTCHRGRSYRLFGLRLALRDSRTTEVVQ